MVDTTTTTIPAGTTQVAPTTPEWYDTLAQNFGGQIQGGLDQVQQLAGNWYDQPLTAGLTPEQQALINQGATTAGQWEPQFQQGVQNVQSGLQRVQTASQYDPAQMQQHLNPYLGGVLDEIARRGNQNLTQNIMPAVNQTFTGSGLFGSSRNADFLQNAMQKTQQEVLGTQANAGLQAFQQAAQDYSNWGQLGTQGGQTMAQIGQNQGTQALAGQGQRWGDLTQQYGLQEQQRANTQQGLDAAYKDWQSQLSTPLNMMGALSQMIPQTSSLYQGAKTTTNVPLPTENNTMNDLLLILAAMGTAGTPA